MKAGAGSEERGQNENKKDLSFCGNLARPFFREWKRAFSSNKAGKSRSEESSCDGGGATSMRGQKNVKNLA